MSAYYINLIPDQLRYSIEDQELNKVVTYLQNHIVAMEINVKCSDEVMFIDSGGYLEEISCPKCKKAIPWDWWSEKMDEAYKNKFCDLSVIFPCCQQESTLDKLVYNELCCFSNWYIELVYPQNELTKEDIDILQRMLKVKIKVVHCRI